MTRPCNFQLVGVLVLALLDLYGGISATPAAIHPTSKHKNCKCMPGDACWPSTQDWTALNSSLHGKLFPTIPIGSLCYDPTYVEAECLSLKHQWYRPDIQ